MKGIKDFCTHTRFHAYTPTRMHALTLIELVIVCAIIAVLVGIVWAATASIREKGRQIHCMNNLKQIHLALVMYRENWGAIAHQPAEGILPHELGLPVSVNNPDPLLPYVKSEEVFICLNDYERTNPYSPYYGAYSYVQYWPPFPYHGNFVINSCFSLYKEAVKHCGERFVLFTCDFHGLRQGTDAYIISLRWNGQIKGHYIKMPLTLNPCLDPP